MMSNWKWERAERRLGRVGVLAKALGRRLGKGELHFCGEAHGTRISMECRAPFWSAFTHLVRTAVDHGVESSEDRVRRNKPPTGTIGCDIRRDGPRFVIELSDDGYGVDGKRVAARAADRGMAHANHDDLVRAFFASGLTTQNRANEMSGRGVGLSAVATEVEALGRTLAVVGSAAHGTTSRIELPVPASARRRLVSVVPGSTDLLPSMFDVSRAARQSG